MGSMVGVGRAPIWFEAYTVGLLTCDYALLRRSGNRKRFSDSFLRLHVGAEAPISTARRDGKELS